MTPKISHLTAILGAALVLGVPAAWGQTGPDAFERAVLAREQSQRADAVVATYPDAFERASVASQRGSNVASYADAHGRTAFGGERQGASAVSVYPDAFERALLQGSTSRLVADSHDRVTPTSVPVVGPVSTDGDLEWPQIGIGFGVGILLALGLGMAMRLTGIRPLAH